MKYCSNCGSQLSDQASFCPNYGAPLSSPAAAELRAAPSAGAEAARRDEALVLVVKIFLILSCVALGAFVLPLCWCIPITVSIFRRLKNGEPISVGLKVCTLIFVSVVAGIILLCMED